MKKYAIFALTLVLTALSFTGCRNGRTPSTSVTTVPTTHATTVPTTHATTVPTTHATTEAATHATTEATHDTTHGSEGTETTHEPEHEGTAGTEEAGENSRSIRSRRVPAR